MKPTHTSHRIHIDATTKAAMKQLQERHPLGTLSAVVAQAINAEVHPVTGAERARQFLRQAGGNFEVASELLLRYLHSKYRDFHSKRQPGKREYDRIRKSLHNIQRCS